MSDILLISVLAVFLPVLVLVGVSMWAVRAIEDDPRRPNRTPEPENEGRWLR